MRPCVSCNSKNFFSQIDISAEEFVFNTKFSGELKAFRSGDLVTLEFPQFLGEEVDVNSLDKAQLMNLCNKMPVYAEKAKKLMLVYEDEETVLSMKPTFDGLFDGYESVSVTAKSKKSSYDFISRVFYYRDGMVEDSVTGSAHCTLGPYWSKELNKKTLKAFQASKRGGEMSLTLTKDKVHITADALIISEGAFILPLVNNTK